MQDEAKCVCMRERNTSFAFLIFNLNFAFWLINLFPNIFVKNNCKKDEFPSYSFYSIHLFVVSKVLFLFILI